MLEVGGKPCPETIRGPWVQLDEVAGWREIRKQEVEMEIAVVRTAEIGRTNEQTFTWMYRCVLSREQSVTW